MPIYEYQCMACGHKLEKLQKISDAPLTDCPACAQPDLRKLVSAVAFRLKGGGWYETDFKDEQSRKNVAKEDGKPAAAETGKDGQYAGTSPGHRLFSPRKSVIKSWVLNVNSGANLRSWRR